MGSAKRSTHATHAIVAHAAPAVPVVVAEPKGLTKVYWSPDEKAAFASEARGHGQRESEYARFILNARKDPLLFLQLCRLRDPSFAHGLMGNPADAGRVAELEKKALEAEHESQNLRRDREELARKLDEAERKLAEATDRAQDLAAQVVSLARVQQGAQERALETGSEYEATHKPFLGIVKALSVTPRLTRKELEARLVEAGQSPAEATQGITGAARLGLIVKGNDARYRLAKPPTEDEEE